MDSTFVFDPPSDEEPQYELESEEDEENVEGEKKSSKSQSPWDFSSYSESVAEEHYRRNTTSIDDKISRVRLQRSLSLPNVDDDDDSDVELQKQEDYKPEEADEEPYNAAVDPRSFFSVAEGVSYHAKSFMELNLSRPLLRACDKLGYTKPTPIQAACIPFALAGRDICGSAITGSGKTAAFSLPTLERLLFRPKHVSAIRVLILTPTRELAAQIHSMITNLAQFTDIRCCLVLGGVSIKEQEVALRSMPDIVVATPGRIIDHLRNSMSVDLDSLAVLILDEADRLLELGFSAEIQELIRLCPKRRQTMLFSATMTEQVNDLVQLSLTKPLRLQADPSSKRPSTLTEEVVRVRRNREAHQEAVLLALCSKTFTSKVIVFCGTKQAAHRLKILFGLVGFKAAELHGNLTQVQRLDALELFRKQEVDFLLATDVAARGLDIVGVQTVINFACPRDLTTYVHRVGRTARAGREGYAVTFLTDNERSLLKAIVKRAGSNLKSRIVAEQSISKWVETIEQMEDQVSEILQEEMEEKALRKAEMEASKAENMIEHRDEIFSRPKRTWFVTEREKKAMANVAKESLGKGNASGNDVISAQQAEDLKMKEKRKREREKRLPQKKRRRLEAARETLDIGEDNDDDTEGNKKGKKDKKPITLVDLGHGRAKAVKARKRAEEAGKVGKMRPTSIVSKKTNTKPSSVPRPDEMRELFEAADMSSGNKHLKRNLKTGGAMKKGKNSFKSKSRYKRR